MGRRVFYAKQRGVGHQLLNERWKRQHSRFPDSTKRVNVISSPSKNSREAIWAENGCASFRRGSESAHLPVAMFPTVPADHILREVYAPKCCENVGLQESYLITSDYGFVIEVTVLGIETESIANILTEILSERGMPQASKNGETSCTNPKWRVCACAPREAHSEKTQLFLLQPIVDSSTTHTIPSNAMKDWLYAVGKLLQERALNVQMRNFRVVNAKDKLTLRAVLHECIVRNVRADNLEPGEHCLVDRLNSLQENGFINYFPPEKLGLATSAHFRFAREFLSENFGNALIAFLKDLEGMDPMLQNIWHDALNEADSWKLLHQTRFLELLQSGLTGHPTDSLCLAGLLEVLIEYARAGKTIRFGEVFHRAVPYRLIDSKLRSVSEVCFNSMATIRMRQQGDMVIPGDLVLPRRDALTSLEYSLLNQQIPPTVLLPNVLSMPTKVLEAAPPRVPTLIRDEQQARGFSLEDVVLPVLYPLKSAKTILTRNMENIPRKMVPLWPKNSTNRDAYRNFLRAIGFIDGFFGTSDEEYVGYRHVIAKPKTIQNSLFSSEIHTSSGNTITFPVGAKMTPLTETYVLNTISGSQAANSRPGIRLRNAMWKDNYGEYSPHDGNGETVAMHLPLPPDAFLVSALREVLHIQPASKNSLKPTYKEYGEWKKKFERISRRSFSTKK